jgi:hypothetical protein
MYGNGLNLKSERLSVGSDPILGSRAITIRQLGDIILTRISNLGIWVLEWPELPQNQLTRMRPKRKAFQKERGSFAVKCALVII